MLILIPSTNTEAILLLTFSYQVLKTRKSSCGKAQEVYCPMWGAGGPVLVGGGTSVLIREVPQSWGTPQKGLGTNHWLVYLPGRDMGPVIRSIMRWRWGNPPLRCELTIKLKLLPSLILRMQAIINYLCALKNNMRYVHLRFFLCGSNKTSWNRDLFMTITSICLRNLIIALGVFALNHLCP